MAFSVSNKRIYIIFVFFALLILAIICKLFFIQVIDADAKRKEAVETRTISYNTLPRRGTIYDRNGNVLAYSKEARTIYANPSEIENVVETAGKLAQHLGGQADDYIDILSDREKKFSYIKRRVEIDVANKLKDESLVGIYFQEDQKREYPYGRTAGQIIGAVNIDGDGFCGVELYYDDILRGSTGKTVRQQGMFGMPIPGGVLQETSVIDGQDIMLTIDVELQQKVESTLEKSNSELGSKSMHSILMDSTNGEIFAAASLPFFNPADINTAEEGATDLKCISTTFEPGSTFKTIAATAILENDALKPETQIYCPNSIAADEYEVSDAHDRSSQSFTFREIMTRSSNVGISLATEKLGWQKYYEKILRYKMNDETGVDYPGDTTGYLNNYKEWSKIQAYNVTFGQGVSVTPLQTSRFYGALANNGIAQTPHFLMKYLQADKEEEYPEFDLIDNKSVLPTINDILRGVVTEGTGKLAEIPGYGVSGKTGTGEIADNNGKYIEGIYYASFVGYLGQANIPMLCFVGAERVPSEASVTLIWKEIMELTIERLKIVGNG